MAGAARVNSGSAPRIMTIPSYWLQATRELSERDPIIRQLVSKTRGLTLRSRGDAFNTLARSIVGQQISTKAAASVWQKLSTTVTSLHPEVIHAHDAEILRGCGLSRSKVQYLQDLARHFVEKRLA